VWIVQVHVHLLSLFLLGRQGRRCDRTPRAPFEVVAMLLVLVVRPMDREWTPPSSSAKKTVVTTHEKIWLNGGTAGTLGEQVIQFFSDSWRLLPTKL